MFWYFLSWKSKSSHPFSPFSCFLFSSVLLFLFSRETGSWNVKMGKNACNCGCSYGYFPGLVNYDVLKILAFVLQLSLELYIPKLGTVETFINNCISVPTKICCLFLLAEKSKRENQKESYQKNSSKSRCTYINDNAYQDILY